MGAYRSVHEQSNQHAGELLCFVPFISASFGSTTRKSAFSVDSHYCDYSSPIFFRSVSSSAEMFSVALRYQQESAGSSLLAEAPAGISSVFDTFAAELSLDPSEAISLDISQEAMVMQLCKQTSANLENEKNRVKVMFDEYCSRQGISQEWEMERSRAMNHIVALWKRELQSENEIAQLAVAVEESRSRQRVVDELTKFTTWVLESLPAWTAGVRRTEAERVSREALEREAKRQLAADLRRQEELQREAFQEVQKEFLTQSIPVSNNNGSKTTMQRAAETSPVVSMSPGRLDELARELEAQEAALVLRMQQRQLAEEREASHREQLRQQQIARVAAEEEQVQRRLHDRQQQAIEALRQQEAELQRRIENAAAERTSMRRVALDHVAAEAAIVQTRLQAREAAAAAAANLADRERKAILDSMVVEEQLLAQKMEARRLAAEQQRVEMEQQRRAALKAELEAEELKLQARLAERSRASLEEAKRNAEQAQLLAERRQREKEELLRRLREEEAGITARLLGSQASYPPHHHPQLVGQQQLSNCPAPTVSYPLVVSAVPMSCPVEQTRWDPLGQQLARGPHY